MSGKKQGEGEDNREGRRTRLSPGLREEFAVTCRRCEQCGEELPQCLVGWGPGKGKKPGADAHQCDNTDRLEIGYKLGSEARNSVGCEMSY